MSQLSNSFSKFLVGPQSDLTGPEAVYFDTVSLLTTLIPFCIGIDRSAPVPEVFAQLSEAVKVGIDTLLAHLKEQGNGDVEETVSRLSSMHGVALLRDTAVAVKLATQWILAFNEREKERDRSGQSSLPKDVVSQIKGLQTAAEEALKAGKARVAKLKGAVVPGGGLSGNIRTWVFDEAQDIGSIIKESTVSELVASWRSNINGWQDVKWE